MQTLSEQSPAAAVTHVPLSATAAGGPSPTPAPGRFDYVAYDDLSKAQQSLFKRQFENLASLAETGLADGRYKALVLTKLEEAYAFVGKAIRDAQIARGPATLNEARGE